MNQEINRAAGLVADIGGTHARFARCEWESAELSQIKILKVADYSTINAAIQTYLDQCRLDQGILHEDVLSQSNLQQAPTEACLAIACPVIGDQVTMTNHRWSFSRASLCEQLGLERLEVINDFAAVSYAMQGLSDDQLITVGGGIEMVGQPQAIVGPGTGLGVSGLLPNVNGPLAMVGEGGHVDFAPSNEHEVEVLKYLWSQHEHVSVEYLLSGAGLSNIHQAMSEMTGVSTERLTPANISDGAILHSDDLCRQVLHCFCGILGSVAGNAALMFGALGGVYIAGGIIPRILPFFMASEFRERFEAKGRYSDYMQAIPTWVVTADQPGLLGAAAFLQR